jgi:hypothetical protein
MYEKAAELNHKLYGAYYNLGQICCRKIFWKKFIWWRFRGYVILSIG